MSFLVHSNRVGPMASNYAVLPRLISRRESSYLFHVLCSFSVSQVDALDGMTLSKESATCWATTVNRGSRLWGRVPRVLGRVNSTFISRPYLHIYFTETLRTWQSCSLIVLTAAGTGDLSTRPSSWTAWRCRRCSDLTGLAVEAV